MYILSGYPRLLLTSFVKHWRNIIIISIAHGDDRALFVDQKRWGEQETERVSEGH